MNDWLVCAKTSNCSFLLVMFKARDFTCRDETRDWRILPMLVNMLRFVVWPIQGTVIQQQKEYGIDLSSPWTDCRMVMLSNKNKTKNQVKLMILFIENFTKCRQKESMVGEKMG